MRRNWNEIGMLRITSKRTLDIEKELCAWIIDRQKVFWYRQELCVHFIDWQKAFGHRQELCAWFIDWQKAFRHRQELYACFIDWQKAFDNANRNKLMQMLKGNGLSGVKGDWSAYWTWIRVLNWDWTRKRQVEVELDRNALFYWFYSTCTVNTLARNLLKGLETSK